MHVVASDFGKISTRWRRFKWFLSFSAVIVLASYCLIAITMIHMEQGNGNGRSLGSQLNPLSWPSISNGKNSPGSEALPLLDDPQLTGHHPKGLNSFATFFERSLKETNNENGNAAEDNAAPMLRVADTDSAPTEEETITPTTLSRKKWRTKAKKDEGQKKVPHGQHKPEEMALTDVVLIDKPDACSSITPYPAIVILVQSGITNKPARDAIRATWGGVARNRSQPVLFAVGKSNDNAVQKQLLEEDAIHHDIIQFGFMDHYHNLTLKTTASVGWASRRCPSVHFMYKIDDDTFVNMNNVVDYAINNQPKKTIVGSIRPRQRVMRDETQKNTWFVSREAWPNEYYPVFALGVGYLISGDSLPLMYKTARSIPAIYLEDVFTTGIVGGKAGMKHVHIEGIHQRFCDVDPCNYDEIWTVHHCAPGQIAKLWYNIENFPHKEC